MPLSKSPNEVKEKMIGELEDYVNNLAFERNCKVPNGCYPLKLIKVHFQTSYSQKASIFRS